VKNTACPTGFRWSQGAYMRLLHLYPPQHRADYGHAMAQLFRDQCRDAWHRSRTWGLAVLWLRTLPDLASTSILERLAALKERKTMTEKHASLFTFRITPVSTFFRVFVVVFLLVFIASAAVTFIMPESYASTARVKLTNNEENAPPSTASAAYVPYDPYFIQTTFEVMQSELVLKPVIDNLKLNEKWGKKYYGGTPLNTTETLKLLRRMIELTPVKNTQLISITAYSEDKNEAAEVANAIAMAYRDYRVQSEREHTTNNMHNLMAQFDNEEQHIKEARANVDALRKKFNIVESNSALDPAAPETEMSVRKMSEQLALLRPLTTQQKRQTLPTLVADPTLSDLLGKLNEAEQKYATITNDYALASPEVKRVASLFDELNREIDDRVNGIMTGLETQLASSKAALEELTAKIQRSKPQPETQEYWSAKAELEQAEEVDRMMYVKIASDKMDAQTPKSAPVQIVDWAAPGSRPVRPNKTLDLVLGAALGVFLGTGAGATGALISLLAARRPNKTALAA
jgi:uncharacterized protein involved in exopolysaccharide biosynthesis